MISPCPTPADSAVTVRWLPHCHPVRTLRQSRYPISSVLCSRISAPAGARENTGASDGRRSHGENPDRKLIGDSVATKSNSSPVLKHGHLHHTRTQFEKTDW